MGRVLKGTYTSGDYRNFVTAWDRYTRPMAYIKPGRKLGGANMDDFVSQRRAVSLCPECQHKYGDWHTKVGYSRRDTKSITDCDGCGESPVLCTEFYSSLIA